MWDGSSPAAVPADTTPVPACVLDNRHEKAQAGEFQWKTSLNLVRIATQQNTAKVTEPRSANT